MNIILGFKKIYVSLFFLKGGQNFCSVWRGDEDTLRTWTLLYWPITSSSLDDTTLLSSGLYIFASSAPQPRATAGHCLSGCLAARLHDLMTISRLKTVPWLPYICCALCIYNFTTPIYSGCPPCVMLPLNYTGVSCNHIVYTAGTSGSVKGQYATYGIACLIPIYEK